MSAPRRPPASASARRRQCTPVDTENVVTYLNQRMDDIANGKCSVNTLFPDFFNSLPNDVRDAHKTLFRDSFRADYQYNENNKTEYRRIMGQIRNLRGFVRVITQNLHCRDRSIYGARKLLINSFTNENADSAIMCEAYAPGFYDDQRNRTQAFIDSLNTGELSILQPDVIAIQEMQEYSKGGTHSRELIKNAINDGHPTWGLELPMGNAKKSGFKIPSGLGFIYRKQTVRNVWTQLYQFPTQFSSGADAGAPTTDMSFKGVLVGEFEVINTRIDGAVGTGKKLVIFNIHPSPFVELAETTNTPRSALVDQIIKTHMYQYTFIAILMKSLMNERFRNTRKPTVLFCGDWNINKFLSNGTTGFGNTITPRDYEQIIEQSPARGGVRPSTNGFPAHVPASGDPALVLGPNTSASDIQVLPPAPLEPIKKRCFSEDAPYIGIGTDRVFGKYGVPEYCDNACCGAEIKTVYEILQVIPPAHLKFIQESDNEAIVPFGGKYTWDALFNSVMYSPLWSTFNFQLIDHIVYSRYGAIPSFAFTKVRRLTPTNPIPVTEGLLSEPCLDNKSNFDEGGYNRNLLTLLQGYVTTFKNAVPGSAGQTDDALYTLIKALKRDGRNVTEPQQKFFEIKTYHNTIYKRIHGEEEIPGQQREEVSAHLKNMYTDPANSHRYFYYDLADHYALECVLVLDDSEDTIYNLKNIIMDLSRKKAQLPFECWKDTMVHQRVNDTHEMFPRRWFKCSKSFENLSNNNKDIMIDGINKRLRIRGQNIDAPLLPAFKDALKDALNTRVLYKNIEYEKYYEYNSERIQNLIKNHKEDMYNAFKEICHGGVCTNTTIKNFRTYVKRIINKGQLYVQNDSDFDWLSEPIRSINFDITKRALTPSQMRTIHNIAFKFFNRFLEREILNRVEFAEIPEKAPRALSTAVAKLYNLGYDVGNGRTIPQTRKNALKKINRGIETDIEIIPRTGANGQRNPNRSASLPTGNASHGYQLLFPAGGRRTTRKHKHRTTRKRKHHNKRHTRKH